MAENESKIKVGVGAVVFRGEDVLVIRRGKPPFEGKWSIPGGGLHFNERLDDAVKREVAEETAVEIRIGGLIDVFEAVPSETGYDGHVVMVDYWAEWVSGDPVAADDAVEAEFVTLETALSRVSWDETRTAIASASKLRNIARAKP